MALKTDSTGFATSKNLATELALKNAIPTLEDGMVVFDNAANDKHLLITDFSNGTFKAVNESVGITSFDDILASDPLLTRCWVERELNALIANWPDGLIQGSTCTLNAGTWTCVITHNGINYTGTDTSKPDSMAKAFIKVLKAIP